MLTLAAFGASSATHLRALERSRAVLYRVLPAANQALAAGDCHLAYRLGLAATRALALSVAAAHDAGQAPGADLQDARRSLLALERAFLAGCARTRRLGPATPRLVPPDERVA